MGNSADRAWHLSQLVEGVLTACNPSAWQPVLRQNKLRCYPRCWLFSCLGFEFPTPLISPKEHQKERCGHSRSQRSFITFSWCASEYSVAGRIFCFVLHVNVRTNVCQWPSAENFLLPLPLLNRIDSIPASEKAGHCDLRILRLKRIANTAGVRTHGEMSVSALRLYCSFYCWGNPTPLSCRN